MVDGYESQIAEDFSFCKGCLPFISGVLLLLSTGIVTAFSTDYRSKSVPRPEIKLESKLDAYSANINNDNYPDLIIRRNGDYSAYLGQENGYKPYHLTEQQRKTIEEKFGE